MAEKSGQEIGDDAFREAVQEAIDGGLRMLTPARVNQFERIYSKLPESKRASAYDLIQRTIRKN